jgi:hypothetical protein
VKLQADWAAKLITKSETKTALGISMVLIPPSGEALPKPYWIGKYEVTQGEWKAVTGSNPASFRDGRNAAAKGLDTSRHPVETVTWFECLGRLPKSWSRSYGSPSGLVQGGTNEQAKGFASDRASAA